METLKSKVSNLVESAGDMSSLFGNPFGTPVGQKIEQATDGNLASENWQLNMEICDMINSSEDVAKDAVRAIKKRLQQVKNYTVIMYTLTVLETCVKNCDKRFHFMLFHNKDFTNELVKIIGPKNDPPTVVTEKVLGLIQSWADTFKQPEYQGVVSVYEDLKCKGIEFPMTDLDSMAPILTPKRTVQTPPSNAVGSGVAVPRIQNPPSTEEPILHPVNLGQTQLMLTPEQSTKLKRDISQVQGNMAVFSEMLSDLKHNENSEDVKFLEDLHKACKEMQRRIAILLCTISSEEELMTDLLHVNDELNNLFLRYGRYRKNVEKTNPKSDEPSLIDFDAGVSAVDSKKPSGAIPKKLKDEDKEFDMLARSRNDGSGSSKPSGAQATKLPDFGDANPPHSSLREATFQPKNLEIDDTEFDEILQSHTESDFNEMEQWLSTGNISSRLSSAGGGTGTGEVLSSSEFDKFLAERAAAAAAKDQKKPDEK